MFCPRSPGRCLDADDNSSDLPRLVLVLGAVSGQGPFLAPIHHSSNTHVHFDCAVLSAACARRHPRLHSRATIDGDHSDASIISLSHCLGWYCTLVALTQQSSTFKPLYQPDGNVHFRASYRTAPRLNKPSNDDELSCTRWRAVRRLCLLVRSILGSCCRHVTIIVLQ